MRSETRAISYSRDRHSEFCAIGSAGNCYAPVSSDQEEGFERGTCAVRALSIILSAVRTELRASTFAVLPKRPMFQWFRGRREVRAAIIAAADEMIGAMATAPRSYQL